MMLGEMDYSDVLTSNVVGDVKVPGTNFLYVPLPELSYVMFVLFVLAVSIVLMNLLVSDVCVNGVVSKCCHPTHSDHLFYILPHLATSLSCSLISQKLIRFVQFVRFLQFVRFAHSFHSVHSFHKTHSYCYILSQVIALIARRCRIHKKGDLSEWVVSIY